MIPILPQLTLVTSNHVTALNFFANTNYRQQKESLITLQTVHVTFPKFCLSCFDLYHWLLPLHSHTTFTFRNKIPPYQEPSIPTFAVSYCPNSYTSLAPVLLPRLLCFKSTTLILFNK